MINDAMECPASSGDALVVTVAALVRALDQSGGLAERLALLIRLAAPMTDLSATERAKLTDIARVLEGLSG